jgi:HK97 gp10 family phage protein
VANEFIKISGLPAVLVELDKLTDNVKNAFARRAAIAGARVIQRYARGQAPIGKSKRLRRNIVVGYSKKRSRKNETQVALVRVRGNNRMNADARDNSYYGGWVEFGHKIVGRLPQHRAGSSRRTLEYKLVGLARKQIRGAASKRTRPSHYMRTAFTATSQLSITAMRDSLLKDIDKAQKK